MSNDYSKYEIEDFAFNESFQKWALGENSEPSGFWEHYIARHPEQTDKILAARLLVQELNADEKGTELYADLQESVWKGIQMRVRTPKVVVWRSLSRWQIAASVVLAIATVIGLYRMSVTSGVQDELPKALADQSKESIFEEVNRTDNVLKIYLEDGSKVSLSKDSRLTYPKKFGSQERVVHLEGEAFFEVARDVNHPFLIYANETVTKVLGTSFRISAFPSKSKVVVAVTTGKVSVFTRKELEQSTKPRGIILTANLQAEFSKEAQQFSKTIVDRPTLLTQEKNIPFDFNDTPLTQVFTTLEKAYGIEILYAPELVKNRTLRVSLDNESLYEKLEIICSTMGLSYQIVDAKVIIESKTKSDQ